MESYDWSSFIARIPVNASMDTLYRAWSTRSGIEHWFLRMSEYKSKDGIIRGYSEHVTPGDTYTWRWHGWPDEVEEHGIILDCNGKDFFKFTFGDAGICSVTIKEEPGQLMVELVQTEIPDDDKGKHYWHLGCKTGWTFYLTNMKSLFEGGLDLRNKNVNLKNVVNS
jgi:uncharacterized protein YndB with AHSA1/START domain